MESHILSALVLSGAAAGRSLGDEAAILEALKAPELAWLHMQADHRATAGWIEGQLGFLDPLVTAALVAEETRPRAVTIGDGVLLILRGVNTNPGQEPDDMVSVRMWVHAARIVSLSRRPLASIRDIQAAVADGAGPERAGDFVCRLVGLLNERIEGYLRRLSDETDELEECVIAGQTDKLNPRISEARRQVVTARRHVAPQRDALDRLAATGLELFSGADGARLREEHDRLMRTVEELDALRDRLLVLKDEIANAQSERLNRNLYILSVVSAMFLPLGFLTGLMGINLAGMPGAGWSGAFWAFTGLLAVIAALLVILLRRMRMF